MRDVSSYALKGQLKKIQKALQVLITKERLNEERARRADYRVYGHRMGTVFHPSTPEIQALREKAILIGMEFQRRGLNPPSWIEDAMMKVVNGVMES